MIRLGAVVLALLATACAGAGSGDSDAVAPAPPTTLLDYPDAPLRAMWRAMREPRPVEGSALPPRHYNEEWFPATLVDRNEIVPGGPPPDGIPSIDAPQFRTIDQVTELEPDEAVLVFDHDDEVRIYPVRIMIWHEIVNDVVGGTPVTVTYCPLCNSAVAYERTVSGQVLDFGTSGYLYRSGLVMYDRQTESLWTHFDGRAVVGTLMGEQLEFRSVATVSWQQAVDAHPDALVLAGQPARADRYGENRLIAYDQGDEPLRGWFNIDIPEPIPSMSRVVGVRTSDEQVAIPTDRLSERGVVDVTVGDMDVVVFWQPGLASPLQTRDIAGGDDIGATGVFDRHVDGRLLSFEAIGGGFVDVGTSSTWNIRGRAIAGPLAGTQLREIEHLDTFWFAWVGHHPATRLVEGATRYGR